MTAKPVWPLWMIINQLEGDDPLNPGFIRGIIPTAR